ncbi:CDGSH iron-sulfur domain-containing protein [Halomarina rubra]|uniref:CDGSH iron-sulfur domain-containing protein n=1 Tax=Halomarina rubra TaxID=2071873 RepID=A0ABD6AT88_9EURY|nr:CDGSH iron-sulfur domain-containing protein [Halomarina rubra]
MERAVHTYHGADVEVTYDVKRCIHVRECVKGLPNVFDADRRPWIRPDEAATDAVTEVIERCPTGALHYERTDGGPAEAVPDAATVTVDTAGPLYLHGDVHLESPDGEDLLADTRVALCRCGVSANKPLCDGSHHRVFTAPGTVPADGSGPDDDADPTGRLTVTPTRNGPLRVTGSYTLEGSERGARTRSGDTLCRCGGSSNKPFCDGTHAKIGFESED